MDSVLKPSHESRERGESSPETGLGEPFNGRSPTSGVFFSALDQAANSATADNMHDLRAEVTRALLMRLGTGTEPISP